MSGRLSSYRLRRRLAWVGGVVAAAGAIVAAAIAVGNTGRSTQTPIDTTQRAWVYHAPPAGKLTRADRTEISRVSIAFVRTAVARKHLDAAWALLGPEMRAGQTRRSWDSGFNNVVPFDASGILGSRILYSYRDDVAIDLALLGSPNSDWAGKTFTIELKRYASGPRRWLVASWTPKGVGGAGQIRSVAKLGPPPTVRAPLSVEWLLVPLGIFMALIAGLVAWGVRSSVRSRRAARRYAELLRG